MDLCGPIEPVSLGRARFVATFVDDYTGLSVVRLLDYKSKVKDSVMDVLTQMETHYTPQQNGKAERLNRTLMEKVRAMLADSGLPKPLWGEAIVTATLLRNLSPFKDNDKTPYEMFYGKAPNIARLRTFGCKAYVHTPKEKRGKLDDVSTPGIMVGYAENYKGYRILLMDNENVIISRDVVFDEVPRQSTESTVSAGNNEDTSTPEQDSDDSEGDDDGSKTVNGDGSSDNGGNNTGAEPTPPPAPIKRQHIIILIDSLSQPLGLIKQHSPTP
jgi:hypothetical protein